jgi:hypothetical protein
MIQVFTFLLFTMLLRAAVDHPQVKRLGLGPQPEPELFFSASLEL